MKDKRFEPYEPEQSLLLPPNLNDWLSDGHPASFVRDVVAGLDLSAIYDAYAPGSKGGRPPCDPRMMTGLLLHAYCVGEPSSRKIEAEVKELLARAEEVDAQEDGEFGKGRRGDEPPEDLRFRETRLAKIKEAMAELEAEAKAEAKVKRGDRPEREEAPREGGAHRQGHARTEAGGPLG